MSWFKRDIGEFLLDLARQRPAILLTGARQTGKTSLLRNLFPTHAYVSLDLPQLAEEAEESGVEFLARRPAPLIIDEVQYAPKLLRYLKARIDEQRDLNGQYLLTGSQKFALLAGATESLAGRVSVVELHSLSLREIELGTGKRAEGDQLLEWMIAGGYPEVHARGLDPERFYADYVVTYLERDVRQVLQVRNLRDFDRFLRLAAARTGQLLSMNSFAGDLGLSPNTVKSWLAVLEASGVVFLLPPFYRNLGKRMVKTPKLYFLDTGLACFLNGIRSANSLRASAMLGALFETLALGQMVRGFSNRGRSPALYFWRDHYGHEVDFVIPEGEKLRLYECKWAETVPRGIGGFQEVEKQAGERSILSKSVITPVRGDRWAADGVRMEDCVEVLWRGYRR